ncbi:MAG TPA: hypothetical protein VK689_12970, partial [Armatimonadota bacterium]|nr:hypothetical protein [Armatimonadota bacterium]
MPTPDPPPPQPYAQPAAPAPGAEPARRGPVDAVFFGPYGLRAGWRILLYAVMVALLSTALLPLVSRLLATGGPGDPARLLISAVVMLAASLVAGWV